MYVITNERIYFHSNGTNDGSDLRFRVEDVWIGRLLKNDS